MHLSLSEAQGIAERARVHAETLGVPMNIAVVDAGGHLLTFARMDKAILVEQLGEKLRAQVAQTHRAAMGRDFHDVLAGVGVRRAHVGEQHLVYRHAGRRIDDVAVVEMVRAPSRRPFACRSSARRREHAAGDRRGVGTAQAHDADGPLARRSRDGGDGVVELETAHGDDGDEVVMRALARP